MHTVLGLHQPIGVAALEHELDIAEAGLGAFGDGENLDVEAPLVGPAVVHPHQHLGPVLRIGAALTGLDLTNGIALVEFPGEQRAHLKLVEHRLERGGLLRDLGLKGLVVFFASHHVERLEIVDLPGDGRRAQGPHSPPRARR